MTLYRVKFAKPGCIAAFLAANGDTHADPAQARLFPREGDAAEAGRCFIGDGPAFFAHASPAQRAAAERCKGWTFKVQPVEDAPDLVEASAGFNCTGCGRPEMDCSADPCAAVIIDREA